jgi:hypothetical protein
VALKRKLRLLRAKLEGTKAGAETGHYAPVLLLVLASIQTAWLIFGAWSEFIAKSVVL